MNAVRINRNIRILFKFALFCLVGGLLISLLLHIFIDRIPERKLARRFILNNQEIQEQFGKIISVKYGGNGAYVRGTYGKKEGKYSFTIKGTIKKGVVAVRWHSEGSGIGFRVESIELLENWKQPVIIWQSKPDEIN